MLCVTLEAESMLSQHVLVRLTSGKIMSNHFNSKLERAFEKKHIFTKIIWYIYFILCLKNQNSHFCFGFKEVLELIWK